jgi:hypothetical protein
MALRRSNGALCCLFLVYDALQRCPPPFLQSLSVAVFRKRLSFVTTQRPSWTVPPPPSLHSFSRIRVSLFFSVSLSFFQPPAWQTFLAVWLGTALRCAVVVAPLVGYLTWSYLRYCRCVQRCVCVCVCVARII